MLGNSDFLRKHWGPLQIFEELRSMITCLRKIMGSHVKDGLRLGQRLETSFYHVVTVVQVQEDGWIDCVRNGKEGMETCESSQVESFGLGR